MYISLSSINRTFLVKKPYCEFLCYIRDQFPTFMLRIARCYMNHNHVTQYVALCCDNNVNLVSFGGRNLLMKCMSKVCTCLVFNISM